MREETSSSRRRRGIHAMRTGQNHLPPWFPLVGLVLCLTAASLTEGQRPTIPRTSTTEAPDAATNETTEEKNTTKSLLTGIPQKDYVHDPNLPRELNGYNLSSYPFYNSMPEDINFTCDGRHDGFYASPPHKCQVYHQCLFGVRYDFLCANYTAFDQKNFICHFVSEVDCKNSHKYFDRNNDLYTTTTSSTTTPRPRPSRRPRPKTTTTTTPEPAYDDYYTDEEEYDADQEEEEPPPPPKPSKPPPPPENRPRPSQGRRKPQGRPQHNYRPTGPATSEAAISDDFEDPEPPRRQPPRRPLNRYQPRRTTPKPVIDEYEYDDYEDPPPPPPPKRRGHRRPYQSQPDRRFGGGRPARRPSLDEDDYDQSYDRHYGSVGRGRDSANQDRDTRTRTRERGGHRDVMEQEMAAREREQERERQREREHEREREREVREREMERERERDRVKEEERDRERQRESRPVTRQRPNLFHPPNERRRPVITRQPPTTSTVAPVSNEVSDSIPVYDEEEEEPSAPAAYRDRVYRPLTMVEDISVYQGQGNNGGRQPLVSGYQRRPFYTYEY